MKMFKMLLLSLSTESSEEVIGKMLKEINHLGHDVIAIRLVKRVNDPSQYTPFLSGYEYTLERVFIDFEFCNC